MLPGGPRTETDARRWIQETFAARRYVVGVHFAQRLRERKLSMEDVRAVIRSPIRVEPYSAMPEHGGTSWRVLGRDVDGRRQIAIGVEAYQDEDGRWSMLCTIIDQTKRKR